MSCTRGIAQRPLSGFPKMRLVLVPNVNRLLTGRRAPGTSETLILVIMAAEKGLNGCVFGQNVTPASGFSILVEGASPESWASAKPGNSRTKHATFHMGGILLPALVIVTKSTALPILSSVCESEIVSGELGIFALRYLLPPLTTL
jgi:hypothetical protein